MLLKSNFYGRRILPHVTKINTWSHSRPVKSESLGHHHVNRREKKKKKDMWLNVNIIRGHFRVSMIFIIKEKQNENLD